MHLNIRALVKIPQVSDKLCQISGQILKKARRGITENNTWLLKIAFAWFVIKNTG